MSKKRSTGNKPHSSDKPSKGRSRKGSTSEKEEFKAGEGKDSSTSRQRPSRGKFDKKFDPPSRGKSRAGDKNKGQTRRNSIDMKDQKTGFKVTRVKGKERELVWDSEKPARKDHKGKPRVGRGPKRPEASTGLIRLNRYVANAGICSRREADVLIKAGVVKVNGEVVTEMGVKVGPDDVVHYGDQKLSREKLVYVLLNKPKDFVTTTKDPQKRNTVMQLVRGATKERIVPVGRLDRQTTGLLMLTNDGDMAKRLTHPKFGVSKLYHIQCDKKISGNHIEQLLAGVELEDGIGKADKVAYVGDNNREIGMEIHMGKNRIVRRMMEQLGYKVLKLDRVMFAGLTKKNLPRGKYRILTETEVNQLKTR